VRKQLCQTVLYRNVATSETSHHFLDVVPRKVMLRQKFKHAEGETLFREVEIVPFDEQLTERERELVALQPGTGREMTRVEFFDGWLDQLERAVIDLWEPEKFHLISHSSGWDSRVTSLVLKRLEKRMGRDWLGNIVFACYGCECPSHVKVMEYLEWNKYQHAEMADLIPIFERMLVFDDVWTWINGVKSSLSHGTMFIRMLMEKYEIFPQDTQLWYSIWGNTSDHCRRGRKGLYNRLLKQYTIPFSINIYDTDVNDMFGHYDVLEYIKLPQVSLPSQRMQRMLIRYVEPELERIPRIKTTSDFPKVPGPMMKRAKRDYIESWFGREIRPDGVRTAVADLAYYHGWWNLWTRAAMCEHLLQAGHEIGVER